MELSEREQRILAEAAAAAIPGSRVTNHPKFGCVIVDGTDLIDPFSWEIVGSVQATTTARNAERSAQVGHWS